MMFHRWRPSIHDFMVLLPTEPAVRVDINMESKDSGAGMRTSSGTAKSSQNLVKRIRPAE